MYVLTGDLEAIKRVLVGNADNYLKDMRSMGTFHDLLGQGLLTSDGPLWKRMRTTLAKAFRIDALRGVADVTRRAVDRASVTLDGHARAGTAVYIGRMFRKLTLQVIAEATLSMGPDESDEVLPRLYEPLVEECNRRVWLPLRARLPIPAKFRYDRAVRELNEFLTAKIEGRRALRAADPGRRKVDMLDMLHRQLRGRAVDGGDGAADRRRDQDDAVRGARHVERDVDVDAARADEAPADVRAAAGGGGRGVRRRRDAELRDAQAARVRGGVFEGGAEDLQHRADRHAQGDRGRHVRAVPGAGGRAGDVASAGAAPRPEAVAGAGGVSAGAVHGGRRRRGVVAVHQRAAELRGQHFSLLEAKIVLSLLSQRFDFVPEPKNSDARHRFNVPVGPRDGIPMRVRRRAR